VAKRKRGKPATSTQPSTPTMPGTVDLRGLRVSAGLTQTVVAERMGISQRRVSAVESTPIRALELRTLVAFVAALGGSVTVLADLEATRAAPARRAVLQISPP
jgi:transcriptional regulator with XRE-family HTH domain